MADNAAPEHDLIAAAEAAEAAEAEAAAAAAPAPTPARQSRRLQGQGTAEQEAERPSWCGGTCHPTNCVCERPRQAVEYRGELPAVATRATNFNDAMDGIVMPGPGAAGAAGPGATDQAAAILATKFGAAAAPHLHTLRQAGAASVVWEQRDARHVFNLNYANTASAGVVKKELAPRVSGVGEDGIKKLLGLAPSGADAAGAGDQCWHRLSDWKAAALKQPGYGKSRVEALAAALYAGPPWDPGCLPKPPTASALRPSLQKGTGTPSNAQLSVAALQQREAEKQQRDRMRSAHEARTNKLPGCAKWKAPVAFTKFLRQ